MPSPRKRIGFLPSEEVHEIIEKLCTANEFSQSKVTGLLVEEALRSRGVLNESFEKNIIDNGDSMNFCFEQDTFSKNNKSWIVLSFRLSPEYCGCVGVASPSLFVSP